MDVHERNIADAIKGSETIWIKMYGQPEDDVIKVPTKALTYKEHEFYYLWGMPGPDVTVCRYLDHGITWAFSKDSFIKCKRRK